MKISRQLSAERHQGVLMRDGLWRSESLPTAGMMLAQVELVLQVRLTSWF